MKACWCTAPYYNPDACKHCPNNLEVNEINFPDFTKKKTEDFQHNQFDDKKYRETLEMLKNFQERIGWICSKCGGSISPFTISCPHCNVEKETKENETKN